MAQFSSGGSVTIEPKGQSVVVSLTATTGALPTVYSDEALSVSVSFPDTISSNKTYYVGSDCYATLSTLIGGVECATATGATRALIMFGGTRTVVAPTPNVATSGGASGGRELSAATIATTATATVTTAFTDIAGLSVGPVIGSNGIYVDVIGSFGTLTVKTLQIQLYDVTAAAAICQGNLVTVAGAVGLPFAMRVRLAPAAGARAYKVRWAVGSGTDTAAIYGIDQAQSTGLYVVER